MYPLTTNSDLNKATELCRLIQREAHSETWPGPEPASLETRCVHIPHSRKSVLTNAASCQAAFQNAPSAVPALQSRNRFHPREIDEPKRNHPLLLSFSQISCRYFRFRGNHEICGLISQVAGGFFDFLGLPYRQTALLLPASIYTKWCVSRWRVSRNPQAVTEALQ
jgi:hypothetical protein